MIRTFASQVDQYWYELTYDHACEKLNIPEDYAYDVDDYTLRLINLEIYKLTNGENIWVMPYTSHSGFDDVDVYEYTPFDTPFIHRNFNFY
jgi:hypothetical protein